MKLETTTNQITSHIKEAIFSGKFSPGSKLREIDLGEWLEVSRTPIREAIRVLESERLVEIKPNKGAYVRQITFKELDEIIEVRTLIEVHCIRRFISLMKNDDIHEMESIMKKMNNLISRKDYSSYFISAIDFHAYPVSKCENNLLYSMFSNIRNSIRFAQSYLLKNMVHRERAHEEHKTILEAIKERDADRCEKLLREHLEAGYVRKKESLNTVVEVQKQT